MGFKGAQCDASSWLWGMRAVLRRSLLDWFQDSAVQRGLDRKAGPPAEYDSRNARRGIASPRLRRIGGKLSQPRCGVVHDPAPILRADSMEAEA